MGQHSCASSGWAIQVIEAIETRDRQERLSRSERVPPSTRRQYLSKNNINEMRAINEIGLLISLVFFLLSLVTKWHAAGMALQVSSASNDVRTGATSMSTAASTSNVLEIPSYTRSVVTTGVKGRPAYYPAAQVPETRYVPQQQTSYDFGLGLGGPGISVGYVETGGYGGIKGGGGGYTPQRPDLDVPVKGYRPSYLPPAAKGGFYGPAARARLAAVASASASNSASVSLAIQPQLVASRPGATVVGLVAH
ncbi:hypothetical protein GZH46_02763, partial [Fragariocoptes setiger]